MMKIKKRIFTLLSVLLLCGMMVLPVFAQESLPRLVDNADLLTTGEENELLAKLDEISERQQVDVVVVTTDSLGGKSPMEYADDFYDENGYGFGESYDGILLLISMEERDWYITTTGYGITAITDAGREYISDQFLADLSNGDYEKAFTIYAKLCDEFIAQARTGEPYDVGNMPREPFPVIEYMGIALVIGFIAALVATGMMKGQLRTVRSQAAAGNYVKKNSMNVTERHALFLYRHVTRSAKPKSNDSGGGGSTTHTSSSGRTHGGGGGKF